MSRKKLYHRLVEGLRHLFCRHGHGVHSPFAYELIRDVIAESCGYYAYDDFHALQLRNGASAGERDVRLLYRLSLRVKPRVIVAVVPAYSLETYALHRGGFDSDVQTFCVEYAAAEGLNNLPRAGVQSTSEVVREGAPIDLLFIDPQGDASTLSRWLLACGDRIHPQTVLIVKGIRQSRAVYRRWKEIEAEETHVSFDLFHYGLGYFDTTLTPGSHCVGY